VHEGRLKNGAQFSLDRECTAEELDGKEAAHYRINADKVLGGTRESLVKKSSKQNGHAKSQTSGTLKR
jgi:hypothetical protein